jgi:acetyl esterase/lipase
MLIQVGTGDPLREDAERLAARARGHGADVRLDYHQVDTHVFHTFWGFLPEAADAIQQAGRFAASPTRDAARRPRRNTECLLYALTGHNST